MDAMIEDATHFPMRMRFQTRSSGSCFPGNRQSLREMTSSSSSASMATSDSIRWVHAEWVLIQQPSWIPSCGSEGSARCAWSMHR